MKEEYFFILDFGTGAGRCVLINTKGEVVSRGYNQWSPYVSPDLPLGREFDLDQLWGILAKSAREALKKAQISPEKILAISSTSSRHSYVFSDKNQKEIYAGPQTDARGIFTQDSIEDALGDKIYEVTGQWPPLVFAPARLQWFKEEKPEIFKKIAYVMGINDWLVYKLTGKYVTEPSIASATMFLDLHKRAWSDEIVKKLALPEDILPGLKNSGDFIGGLTERAARSLGLKSGIPVVLGGADTQMGLLGCGVVNKDDVGIIAGTSTSVLLVTSAPLVDPKKRLWSSCHALLDKWLLEGNCGMTGTVYDWLKDAMCELEMNNAKKRSDNVYQLMDQLAAQVPPGSNDSYAVLGPIILNAQELCTVRPGFFIFPPSTLPGTEVPFTRKHLIRTTLENICYAANGNRLQLEEISGKKISHVSVTGGMVESDVWVEMLANVLGVRVKVTGVKEGSSLGCAICAAVGIRMYKNLEESAKALVKIEKTVEPNHEIVDIYKDAYQRWLNLYNRTAELL